MKIPLFSIPDAPLSESTQNYIPVAEVTEDLILYKNGAVTMIMESTSLNFGLLSDKEQQAVIAGYAALLNSLTFHMQIVVKSQQKDISNYLTLLDEAEKKITNDKLTNIMTGYKKFISDSIKRKNVLSKKFYLVIPFTQYELGLTKSLTSKLNRNAKDEKIPYTKSYVIRKAKISLYPKREHLVRQAQRLGIQLKQLRNKELISLVYNLYNPIPPVKSKTLPF